MRWNRGVELAVLACLAGGLSAQAAPFMYEDFQGYPPGTTHTYPEGFITVRRSTITTASQNFDYQLWDEEEEEGIIRWHTTRSGTAANHRLVYVGDETVDPSEWEDYTVRIQFETPTLGANRIHAMARLQGNSTDQLGYSAIWFTGAGTGNELPDHLLIRKDNFDYTAASTNDAFLIAYSTNSFAMASNTVYTLEFILQGTTLKANLYEGTDLTAPNALKLTAEGTDATYSSGTAALGSRLVNDTMSIYFHSIEVIPEPTILGLFGVAGVVLFSLRGRRRRQPQG